MKIQCLAQKFTSCCIARGMRMIHINMFISNAVQIIIIQTNKNCEFAGKMQIKLIWIPEALGCSLVVEPITVGRSF